MQIIKPFISKSCSLFLHYGNYPQILYYQSLSGFGQNRLGLYYQCIADDTNRYFLIQAHTRSNQLENYYANDFMHHDKGIYYNQDNLAEYLSDNFTIGFCFNKACSSEDLSYGIQSTSKYRFIPFQIDRVINPALIVPQFDEWTILMLVFIALLVVSCITSSILKIYFKYKKYKKQHLIIQCFSLQNTIRLLSYKRNNLYDQMRVFSGIKFLSFLGILTSHMLILLLNAPSTKFKQSLQLQIFFPLFYSVDVWLAISGFFLSYIALKQFREFNSVRIHLLRIARRFFRYWPIYIVIVLFTWRIAPFVGSGPLWGYAINLFQTSCGAEFFNYLLLIQNFAPSSCNTWLWLWQTDIQLCIFFTPLLLLYCKYTSRVLKFIFFSIQLILLIISILVPPLYQSAITLPQYFSLIQTQSINVSPLSRVGAYMVGYNLGILFFQFRKTQQIRNTNIYQLMARKIVRVGIVLVSMGILVTMVYYINVWNMQKLTYYDKTWFASFHFFFPLVVCMIISPPLFGFMSLFKMFLQFSKFSLLSKLSMSAYCVHFIIQVATIYSRKTDLYLNNLQIAISALYSLLPIFAVSICFTALLQMPLYVAKKIYLKTPRITYFEH